MDPTTRPKWHGRDPQDHRKYARNSAIPRSFPTNSTSRQHQQYRNDNRYNGVVTTPRPFPVKVSEGIGCVKPAAKSAANQELRILMVCKRHSYYYSNFVHGKYDSADENKLRHMFSNMNADEKIDIASCDYARIWYRMWRNVVPSNVRFHHTKNKFDRTFRQDGGVRLRRLLSETSTAGKIWELPKGRKSYSSEGNIECAVREFCEESGLPRRSFRVLCPKSIRVEYVDDNVKYITNYVVARAVSDHILNINYNTLDQVDEISDIRWMTINEIKLVDETKRTISTCKKILYHYRKIMQASRRQSKQRPK